MQSIVLYLRQRVRPAVFVPAISILTALSLWAVAPVAGSPSAAIAAAVTAVLVVQFRIWDDLEDREADARVHPERVLARMPSGPVRSLGWTLGVVALVAALASGAWIAAAVIVNLDVVFWLIYRHVRPWLPERVWRYQVLPLKYAGFVVAGALAIRTPDSVDRLTAAALLAWLGAVAYEYLHTRRPAAAGAAR
jgi:hypothetical protein